MVAVKGGTFSMGGNDGESNEKPVHSVTVSDFYMGKYEVTFAQYDVYCEATGKSKPNDSGWGRGNRPVINVSWFDSDAYCKWLSQKTGKTYRLPTEAEWEYAARAGATAPFNTGNCLSTSQANYDGNYPYTGCSKGEYTGKTLPVGSFSPNAWGLFDMHGNVWEWCSDWYDAGYYANSPRNNPPGGSSGAIPVRVLRGGSWYSYALFCRVSYRSYGNPDSSYNYFGFRLVLVPD
jgi:formylglycine-generating enzyme required for sulfatase activity